MEGLVVTAETRGPKMKVNIGTAGLRNGDSYNLHGLQLSHYRVREYANLVTIVTFMNRRCGKSSDLAGFHVLEVHTNLASNALSKS
jgi:hypothetical protein